MVRLARLAIQAVAAFVFGYLLVVIVDQVRREHRARIERVAYFAHLGSDIDALLRSIRPAAPGAPDLGQAWTAHRDLMARGTTE